MNDDMTETPEARATYEAKREAEEEAKIAKLPHWAQRQISSLKKRAASWKRAALACTVEGASDVMLIDGIESHSLPPGSSVRFVIDGNHIDVRSSTSEGRRSSQHPDNVLIVSSSGRMSVLPASSNLAHIRTEAHFSSNRREVADKLIDYVVHHDTCKLSPGSDAIRAADQTGDYSACTCGLTGVFSLLRKK